MKEEIIQLWKTSFNDSQEFIDLFFNQVYKDEQTLIIKKNDTIISALQIIPYEMSYFGKNISMGYICGVCTLPEERGKGYMKQLMYQAYEKMLEDQVDLASLIPASDWLFQYYETLGYTTIFDYSVEKFNYIPHEKKDLDCLILTGNEISKNLVYTYYNQKQRERKCTVLHTQSNWETILQDCLLDGGNVWVALQDQKLVGIALAIPTDNQSVFFKELFYEKETFKSALIHHILNYFNDQTAQIRISANTLQSSPYGMAQIINHDRIIDLFLSKNKDFEKCELQKMDTPTLTKTIFKYKHKFAFLNLMLD